MSKKSFLKLNKTDEWTLAFTNIICKGNGLTSGVLDCAIDGICAIRVIHTKLGKGIYDEDENYIKTERNKYINETYYKSVVKGEKLKIYEIAENFGITNYHYVSFSYVTCVRNSEGKSVRVTDEWQKIQYNKKSPTIGLHSICPKCSRKMTFITKMIEPIYNPEKLFSKPHKCDKCHHKYKVLKNNHTISPYNSSGINLMITLLYNNNGSLKFKFDSPKLHEELIKGEFVKYIVEKVE